jgi:hypothetical protein
MRYYVSIRDANYRELPGKHRCYPDTETAKSNALYLAALVGGRANVVMPDPAEGCYCAKIAPHNCDYCVGLH